MYPVVTGGNPKSLGAEVLMAKQQENGITPYYYAHIVLRISHPQNAFRSLSLTVPQCSGSLAEGLCSQSSLVTTVLTFLIFSITSYIYLFLCTYFEKKYNLKICCLFLKICCLYENMPWLGFFFST